MMTKVAVTTCAWFVAFLLVVVFWQPSISPFLIVLLGIGGAALVTIFSMRMRRRR